MKKLMHFLWQDQISVRLIAMINILVALDFWRFWYNFYHEKLFIKAELSQLLEHYEAYMAWEQSFTLPDIILSIAMLLASLLLLRKIHCRVGRAILYSATGGLLFLGILDFNYSIHNGMYTLGIDYSLTLLTVGVGLPILAICNFVILAKSAVPITPKAS